MINSHNGIKEKCIKPLNINDYPAIKKHLDNFYPELVKRIDKGDTPYNLRNCAYMEDFSRPKIIFQEMVQEPSFMVDFEGKYFCLDTARIITGKDIDTLSAILNSDLFFYAIKNFYGGGGLGETGVRMKHTFFMAFPAPTLDEDQKLEINYLTKNPSSKNIHRINDIIYDYYKLDTDEREAIDFIEIQ